MSIDSPISRDNLYSPFLLHRHPTTTGTDRLLIPLTGGINSIATLHTLRPDIYRAGTSS